MVTGARRLLFPLALGMACASGVPSLVSAGSSFGDDNPTVSYNLSNVRDWSPALPFIDWAHTMRPWLGHEPGQWGGMDYEDLVAGGYLDADGWVRDIPNGLSHVGTIWDFSGLPAAEVAGVYVLTYEGMGEIRIRGADVLRKTPGRIRFRSSGGALILDIMETDPGRTGDYIRDISVVREDLLPLHEAGAMFNPDWLALIAEARELRFMDWMDTNNSTQSSWADRPQLSDATWSRAHIPPQSLRFGRYRHWQPPRYPECSPRRPGPAGRRGRVRYSPLRYWRR